MEFPAEQPSSTSKIALRGTTSVERYIAATIDNGLAIALFFAGSAGLGDLTINVSEEIAQTVIGLSSFTIYLAYFFLTEAILSTTIGKWMCGLHVRKLDGMRCGWFEAMIGTITRIVEVNPLVFGCIPAAIAVRMSQNRQRIGDRLAGTVVIKVE